MRDRAVYGRRGSGGALTARARIYAEFGGSRFTSVKKERHFALRTADFRPAFSSGYDSPGNLDGWSVEGRNGVL